MGAAFNFLAGIIQDFRNDSFYAGINEPSSNKTTPDLLQIRARPCPQFLRTHLGSIGVYVIVNNFK